MRRILSHSGDAGDIIYCGPLLRAIATQEGEAIELVIYPNGGHPIGPTRARQTEASAECVLSLMREQAYIASARYAPHPEGFVLDVWRSTPTGGATLAARQLRPFGFTEMELERPWIEPPQNASFRPGSMPVIIHRSPRYHGPCFPWGQVLEKYKGSIGMVGSPDEHAAFVQRYGNVPFIFTKDFAELASVIAGSALFIGNQSAPYAIAEGMKHNSVQETFPQGADCVFPRENALHVVDGHVNLPGLEQLLAANDPPATPATTTAATASAGPAVAQPPLRGVVARSAVPQTADELVNRDPHWNAVAKDIAA